MRTRSVLTSLVFIAASATAQDIRITTGPVDNQVLQRNGDQSADIHLAGSATTKKANGKEIEARLLGADNASLPGFDWVSIAKVQKLAWAGDLKKVPAGGPYRLEIRLQGSESSVSIANLLVGDLWILAGQSNMEGVGDLVEVQPPVPTVHSFDLADHWLIAEEPLHTLPGAVDAVHWPLNAQKVPERLTGERLEQFVVNRKKGAGLGLPFAVAMEQRTGIPIGLVPCAHGGTSMDQWSPDLKDREGESLYGSMYRRFQAVGGQVKGVLWYQGESDANPKASAVFLAKFEAFVKAVRTDFKQPDLPFYWVQIGRHIDKNNFAEWNKVQVDQLRAEKEIPHSGMIAVVDLQLDDGIHVSTPDLKRAGQRLANLACRDLFPRLKNYGELKSGPRPASAVLQPNNVLKVSFSGVNGKLQSEGRIGGFSIRDASGAEVPMIFKARVDPAEASTVLLYLQGRLPADAVVAYGYGKDPYCNLRDALDMAVPVFDMKIAAK